MTNEKKLSEPADPITYRVIAHTASRLGFTNAQTERILKGKDHYHVAIFVKAAIDVAGEHEDYMKSLAQRIDNAQEEVYTVWNGAGGRLSAPELNHLESALAILGHIITGLKLTLDSMTKLTMEEIASTTTSQESE